MSCVNFVNFNHLSFEDKWRFDIVKSASAVNIPQKNVYIGYVFLSVIYICFYSYSYIVFLSTFIYLQHLWSRHSCNIDLAQIILR